LDFGFFNNRIRGTAEYYVKTAENLLDFNPLPANNAVGRVADNVGSTRSRGIEFSLNTLNIASNRFRWASMFNFSTFKNNWVERNPRVPLAPYIGECDPIRAIYGFETDGIIKSADDIPDYMPDAFPGNLKYVDQNGDGLLNSEDVVLIGNEDPDWTFGFNNVISYKSFDLSISLYGSMGFSKTNNYEPNVGSISQLVNPENTTIYAGDVWSSGNPNGTLPGVASNPYSGNNPTGNDDFYLEKVNFIRLQTISLGYRLPNYIFGAASSIKSARVFVNFDNLGVLSNYSGYDPEYTEPNPYPQAYATTFGVEFKF
jgi:hypothetical protein